MTGLAGMARGPSGSEAVPTACDHQGPEERSRVLTTGSEESQEKGPHQPNSRGDPGPDTSFSMPTKQPAPGAGATELVGTSIGIR